MFGKPFVDHFCLWQDEHVENAGGKGGHEKRSSGPPDGNAIFWQLKVYFVVSKHVSVAAVG